MDVCLLWVLCVVKRKSLRRAGPSSRGVLPTVVCHKCVTMKPRRNEEAQAHIRLSSHRKKKCWHQLHECCNIIQITSVIYYILEILKFWCQASWRWHKWHQKHAGATQDYIVCVSKVTRYPYTLRIFFWNYTIFCKFL
jgi:hypothetical protein